MKSQKVIFVSPVNRIPTQGRDKQAFTIIDPKTGELTVTKGMGKTKEFGTASEYSFPFNARTNRLVTGLDATIPNPIKGLTTEEAMEKYSLSHYWRDQVESLVNQSEIKKQTWYEILDDTTPGYYTSEIAGNVTIFNMTKSTKIPENPNFLQRFKIILYDSPNRFEDDGTRETSRGRLAIELIKVHDRIAKSKQEINSARHHFYISEENEAEMEKMRKQDLLDEATYRKRDLQLKASDYKNYQVASLLTTYQNANIVYGNVTKDMVKQKVNAYLGEGSHQVENIQKFLKITEMLDSKEGRERFEIMYLVQQAVNCNVFTVRDGYYVWNSKAGTPNMYKHSNYDKLISLLQAESKNWNPKDTETTNWYGDLYNELKTKNIWIE